MAKTSVTPMDDALCVRTDAGKWYFDTLRGYVSRFTAEGGRDVVRDDLRRGPDPAAPLHLNEPRAGGIGSFGCHVARDVPPWIGETNTRMLSNAEGWGAHRGAADWSYLGNSTVVHHSCLVYDPWDPLFEVNRRYEFHPDYVLVNAVIHELGADVYIKEPKLQLGICPPGGVPYVQASHYGNHGVKLAGRDLTAMPQPWRGTWQLRSPTRCHLHFKAPLVGVGVGTPGFHVAANTDLDLWAQAANKRPRYTESCAAYCLQGPPSGTLTKAWEVAKRREEPDIGIMLHAWEGGAGAGDCLCAARQSQKATWRAQFIVSYGAGWQQAKAVSWLKL